MNHLYRRFTLVGLVAALLAVAGSAYALKSGPLVTLDDVLLGRIFGRFAAAAIAKNAEGVELLEGTSIDSQDSDTILMKLPVQKDGATFKVEVAFNVTCMAGGNITLFPESSKITGATFKAKFLKWLVDTFAPDVSTKMKKSVERDLASNVFSTNGAGDTCPGIEVQKDGSINLDFGPGEECTSGEQHYPCPFNYKGTGRTMVCENGRWVLSQFKCTPPEPVEDDGK
jgi:hypothetical protein